MLPAVDTAGPARPPGAALLFSGNLEPDLTERENMVDMRSSSAHYCSKVDETDRMQTKRGWQCLPVVKTPLGRGQEGPDHDAFERVSAGLHLV